MANFSAQNYLACARAENKVVEHAYLRRKAQRASVGQIACLQAKSAVGIDGSQVVITFDDAYADTLHAADLLGRFNLPATWFVVSSAMVGQCTWFNEEGPKGPTLLGHQLRHLAQCGMEIGGDSRTHRRMAQIQVSELTSETIQCKSEIEDALGCVITSFSYPYGNYDELVVQATIEAGFERACTTENGIARIDTEKFKLRRVGITANDTISDFARKMLILNDHPGAKGVFDSTRRIIGYRG